MPTIQVLLSPISATIKGGGPAPHVVGLAVDLNLLGRSGDGVTLATANAQPAELLFFEVPAGKDVAREPEQFAKLEGKVRLDAGKPVFESSGKLISYSPAVRSAVIKSGAASFPPETSTDYCLQLKFAPSFRNVDDVNGFNKRLFLPWRDVAAEDSTLDVGCELTINGNIEFKFDAKHFVSVPMTHAGVRLDGVDEGKPSNPTVEFHGVGVVHPTRNWLLAEQKLKPRDIKLPSPPRVELNLHRSVSSLMKDGARVEQAIRECFAGTGITVDIKRDRSDADADAAGFALAPDPHVSGDTTFVAKAAAGASLPFFTYWVVFDTKVNSLASGLQEGILKVTASGGAGTKLVRYPIRLLGGRDADRNLRGMERDLGGLQGADNQDRHVGNVIAHEVGHSFGFDHTLEANPDSGYRLKLGSADLTRCVMCWENLGAFTFTRGLRFGPVFTAMLRRDFALP